MSKNGQRRAADTLPKSATGISGLDEITFGGLPKGRPTLICGSAGCGKTLMAIEFIVRGAVQFGEPGVIISFEESPEELTQNVRSLGFNLDELIKQKKLVIDHIHLNPNEIQEAGDYDLEGLFIRLGLAIDSIGAKRVALDTIETLFGGLSNQALLRAELQRLFRWLKDKGVTAVITGERGEGTLTRHGLEEYVSDCVILLDHRVTDQVSTRRLRVVKYRGTVHGNNEYPFLIDEQGIDVLPVTSLGLNHAASLERVSTGIPRLDAMLGGKGLYRGTTVLISGTAGTGKSSLAARFAAASCERGERCIYFAFEEAKEQIVRNQRSVGLDLRPAIDAGLLSVVAARSITHGLEGHLATMHKHIRDFQPRMVVVDPISDFDSVGTLRDVKSMLTRLTDFLKSNLTTGVFVNLNSGGGTHEETDLGISSAMDTWLLVRNIEANGERNRALYVLKSRGMPHSNQVREFVMTDKGLDLLDVYIGTDGVLTGSARIAQESKERAAKLARDQEIERKSRDLERKRVALMSKIASLQAEFDAAAEEAQLTLNQERAKETEIGRDRQTMARSRQADATESAAATNGPVRRVRKRR